MQKLLSSRTYMRIGIDPPDDLDGPLTGYPCEAALIADDGTEPQESDWHTAEWIGGKVSLMIGPGGALDPGEGDWMAFARITAGQEQPVLKSGRVTIGLGGGA